MKSDVWTHDALTELLHGGVEGHRSVSLHLSTVGVTGQEAVEARRARLLQADTVSQCLPS